MPTYQPNVMRPEDRTRGSLWLGMEDWRDLDADTRDAAILALFAEQDQPRSATDMLRPLVGRLWPQLAEQYPGVWPNMDRVSGSMKTAIGRLVVNGQLTKWGMHKARPSKQGDGTWRERMSHTAVIATPEHAEEWSKLAVAGTFEQQQREGQAAAVADQLEDLLGLPTRVSGATIGLQLSIEQAEALVERLRGS